MTVYIIFILLVSATLLRVGRRGGFSSHTFTPSFYFSWILPIGFLFLQPVFQHLGCLLALASRPCPICTFTWGLCSWGSFWGWMSPTRQRGSQSCRRIFPVLSARDGFIPVRSNWGSPIFSCRRVFGRPTARLVALLLGSWFPKLPIFSGLQNSWRDCFALVSGVPGSLLPDFCSRCPFTKKVLTGCFPSLRRGF